MNNDTHLGLRTALMTMLIVGIALMAGCGSDVGPSVDEVRPDLLIGYSTFKLESTLGFAKGLDDDIGETTVYLRLGANF